MSFESFSISNFTIFQKRYTIGMIKTGKFKKTYVNGL